ncbi:Uncharacterised protein [uncultured archaeon]|nr:Uncharacterised protein [uncultured archaeon]
MNRKSIAVFFLLTLAILIGIPESFARPQYFTALTAVYGDGSCGTCHVNPSGGGPRNSYGMLFESQSNHRANPGAALTAIGSPFSSTATPTDTMTPAPTETPFDTITPPVTTVTPAGTPTAPGFGVVVAVVGLFACALLARRNNK